MSAVLHLLLQHRQQTRSHSVLGAGARDVCVITLLKSAWHIHPFYLFVPSPCGGRSSKSIRCSSTSVLGKLSESTNTSGKVQTIEQDWEEYFADPLQWSDNRFDKMNPESPDFKHKVTMKALWVNGWSTLPWVKAMLKLLTSNDLLACDGYYDNNSHEISQPNRLLKSDFGTRNTSTSSAKASKQTVQVSGGSMRMQNANTTSEAIDLLKNRLQQGIATYSHSYVEILRRCLNEEDLTAVKQVHKCTIESGMLQSMYVANNLLGGYIRCGRLEDARRVFDELVMKNVVTWNVLIGAYAQHRCGKDAMEVFKQMHKEGMQPNAVTYLCILKARASPSDSKWVEEVHAYIRESGLESHVRVGTSLLNAYAKCENINKARNIFDKLASRNVVTWNVMIGAYAESGNGEEVLLLLLRMKQEGFKPDAYTYASILNVYASPGALEWVRDVHSRAREAGFELNVRVGNRLVLMYAKCGSIDDARLVFDKMEERDVVTWSVMIGGLAEHGLGSEAFELFLRMKREGFKPTAITYVNILNPSSSAGALEWVKEVHRHARDAGFESDVCLSNALVHMYAKCGSIDDARLTFDRMAERDVISWNAMIGSYSECGEGEEACRLLLQMKREGFKPDAITYISILNACASAGALEWVRDVHNHVREAELESDVRVGNSLVHMYAKCGCIDDARLIFDRMQGRNAISWNVMIGGLAQHGCGLEAVEVFRSMIAAGAKPDLYSFVALLSACSQAGLVDEGRGLFQAMSRDYGVVPRVVHWNCMVDILGRAGHLEEAKVLIDNMPVEPNGATWGALLGACRSYGNVELGELAANELFKSEPREASTYVILSNIYAAAKKWEKVSMVRAAMLERGIRKDPGRSWIEVNKKIHTFVVGDISHSETKEIHAQLSVLTEKIKADGYIPDTRLVLHDVDDKDKEFSLCSHSEKLAIAYGLIHISSSEPVRVYKNLRVCSDCHTTIKLFSKVSRREIVVRDTNRFHHFCDGLCSCKDYW